jgi:hypothetical protein
LKNIFLIASLGAVLGGTIAAGQEKTADSTVVADPGLVTVSFPAQQQASYSANDIKIVGTIDSGKTSRLVECSRTPEYRAFVFEGNGHDQVEVTVSGGNRYAFVALADSTLSPIASGRGRLLATLPYHGPDIEAFYIIFKSSTNQPAQFSVHLKKTPSAAPADATR